MFAFLRMILSYIIQDRRAATYNAATFYAPFNSTLTLMSGHMLISSIVQLVDRSTRT